MLLLRQRRELVEALGFVGGGKVEEQIMTVQVRIYKEKEGGAVQLHRCPWRFTSEGHMANMQPIGSCSMFPRTPGLSGGRSGFFGFHAIRMQH